MHRSGAERLSDGDRAELHLNTLVIPGRERSERTRNPEPIITVPCLWIPGSGLRPTRE
jgi:hypothetical protein